MNRIEYQLTQDDLVQFNMYYVSVSNYYRKQRLKLCLFIPAICLPFFLLFLYSHQYHVAIFFLAFGLAWFLLYPIRIKQSQRRHFLKHIEEAFGDIHRKPSVLNLQEDGIFSSSYLGESKFPYSSIDRIVEHAGYTYIFIGKGMALVLPHDRISEEDLKSFVDEVNRRMPVIAQPAATS